jgi:3-phytase/alkaline phosphatase D
MRRPTLIGLMLALTAVFWPWTVGAQGPLRLLGQYSFESKRTFQDTTIGGLSGLAFDAKRGVYYAVCDDRGENQAPRYYTLQIDVEPSGINEVRVVGVTFFDSDPETPGVQPYERNTSDLEDIQLLADDTLLVSSERDRDGKPWVRQFALDGSLLGELPLPNRYVTVNEADPDGRPRVTRGVRSNLGFEGMALSSSEETLFLANEAALAQDGLIATLETGTNVRILRMELYGAEGRATSEYVYPVEKIFATPNPPDQLGDNGVSAMLWIRHLLPQFDLLVMERSFVPGVGNDVNIYGVALTDATDVRDVEALPNPYTGRLVRKTLLANMATHGVSADNLEALALGPRLPNGKQSLIVMSDDNFSSFDPPQRNQFVLFEIDAPAP